MASHSHATTGEVLMRYVDDYAAHLRDNAAGVPEDRPDAVHQVRTSARRLRAVLTSYGRVLQPGATDPLCEELRWLGLALGEARDAEVLREHLRELLAAEPAELVDQDEVELIERGLDQGVEQGRLHGLAALESERFAALLEWLREFVDNPPLTNDAAEPVWHVVPELLDQNVAAVARRVKTLEEAEDPAARDLALHAIRKKAKRLRYAAEAAEPALGHRAKRLAEWAREVQTELGTHQDTVVSRKWLCEYAVRARALGESTFTFGRLHALEQVRGARAEAAFGEVWGRAPG